MNHIEHVEFKDKNFGFEIIPLNIFFESVDDAFIKTPYRTSFYNIIYITQGQCIHEVDFIDYTINAGELLIVSRNRVHKYSEYTDVKGYLIMVTEGFLCEFLSNQSSNIKELFKLSHLNPHVNYLDLYSTTLNSLLEVIHDLYNNRCELIDNKVIATTFNAFVQIIINGKERVHGTKYKNDIFLQFSELVEKHIYNVKTVTEYADMMHVSNKTVNLMTRKAIDMSAKQYIIQQLILKIRLKLSFEQKSINEIAYELGFTEPSNLTRFFKKNTKDSPSEFRNEIRKGKNSWLSGESMALNSIKESIEVNVYHIPSDVVVPLHAHEDRDEIFYCIKGSGFAVLEDGEALLTFGKSFIAHAGMMHSLRSENNLYVTAFLVPTVHKTQE